MDFKNGLPGVNSIFFNTVMTHQSCFNSFKNKKGISNKKSVTMHNSTIIFACFIFLLSLSILSLWLFRTFL